MSAVKSSQATVYHGGGRRFFTLKAACRAQAKMLIRRRLHATDEEWADCLDWYDTRVTRLTRFYLACFKARNHSTQEN